MLIVSDIHGEFDALAKLSDEGMLLILGDIPNLVDYRTYEGVFRDVLGEDFVVQISRLRGRGEYEQLRDAWSSQVGDDWKSFRDQVRKKVEEHYRLFGEMLSDARGYATYGNVDVPELFEDHLPDGIEFMDGQVADIEGLRVGFAGGGMETPFGASGEVTDDAMRMKLEQIGEVDILCSHLPPSIEALRKDVVTGRHERGSQPILEFIRHTQPAWHFFGDVHQPQATTWRVGNTQCVNVGYFRATKRPFRFSP